MLSFDEMIDQIFNSIKVKFLPSRDRTWRRRSRRTGRCRCRCRSSAGAGTSRRRCQRGRIWGKVVFVFNSPWRRILINEMSSTNDVQFQGQILLEAVLLFHLQSRDSVCKSIGLPILSLLCAPIDLNLADFN